MPFGLGLLLALLSVAANGFFAGTETGFTSARRVSLLHRARRDRRARLAARMIQDREAVIVTAVVGNNVAVVTGTALATAAFISRYGAAGETYAALIMTALNIVFGEILPKSLYRARPENLVILSAPLLYAAEKLLAPMRWLALGTSRLVLRLLGDDPSAGSEASLTRERILRSLRVSERGREIDALEGRLLNRFVHSSRLSLGEIMTPMERVIAMGQGQKVRDVLDRVRHHGHSRFPLLDDDGNLVGLLLFRDLIRAGRDEDLGAYRRDLVHLDQTMGLDEGISALTEVQMHLAAVVDARGLPRGIVTLEDLMEALLGEIIDEHDPMPAGT